MVDDDGSICTMAKAILESQGYEVQCAVDGFDALTALTHSLPDVIISDLQMPNMNGFEFLSVVRKRFPRIPTIAISGAFSGRDVPDSVLADAFFEKGQYSPRELFEKIAVLLEELPARQHVERRLKPAVWIPLSNAHYIAVTCPSCLRTFPVPAPLPIGAHTAECAACTLPVVFHITDEFRTRSATQ
jgi:CheY-like chemotaxis protein